MTTTYPPTTIRGTVVTYLPLTTPFEAADACSSYFIGVGSTGSGWNHEHTTSLESLGAWGFGYQKYVNTTAGCFPSEVASSAKAASDASIIRMISYIAADDAVPTIRFGPFSCLEGWTSVYSTLEDESAAMTACCPSEYVASIAYSGTRSAVITCLSSYYGTTSRVITYAESISGVSLITTGGTKTVTGTPTFAFRTGGYTSLSVGAAPMKGYNLHVASATQSSESSVQHESGLSTGAKAGIGVGVGVGVLLIIGALIFFLRRHRRGPSNSEPKTEKEQVPETTTIAELRGESRPPVHELHNQTDQPELVGSYTPTNEMAGTHEWPPQELDASEDRPVRHGSQSSK